MANGSYFSQDCKQIKKIKFLLFLNIKSNFIYINILHCYCVDKCEMCYIIKIRTFKCTIDLAVEFNLLKSTHEIALQETPPPLGFFFSPKAITP